jgi:trimethyllysine dioxygenase
MPATILPQPVASNESKLANSHKNGNQRASNAIGVKTCTNGNKVTLTFPDGEFVFHSQWLHDTHCDGPLGAARNVETAICSQPIELVRVSNAEIVQEAGRTALSVFWNNEQESRFPIEWLRVMAPFVASANGEKTYKPNDLNKGWEVEYLRISEVSYGDIFDEESDQIRLGEAYLTIFDHLLHPSSAGLIKIINLPPPNFEDELNDVRNLNTLILKKLFGSVFVHPTRGQDKSFNVCSRSAEAEKRKELPNYDTNQVLLPHADHAFYEQPINVQGWYILEGTSENTFVSMPAVLETLKEESPESYTSLLNTPMALGRVSGFYGQDVYQMTVDTAVSMVPGTNDYKRIRWHPNFIANILGPYDKYLEARLAQQKFLEIMRRPTHQLSLELRPGDMFIWDNFRVLHGREKVYTTPRTGVGQTVSEQVVHDKYRALVIELLQGRINEQWLVHLPMHQLRELLTLVQEGRYSSM